jgi:mono/diheme cytochrome c family protein
MYYTAHQGCYFAHRITLEGLGDDALAQSLSTARVDMNPHQVDAALFALASPLSKGTLLADEVGSEQMRQLAALTLILLLVALSSVSAQEAGNPQAGAAYAKQYCAKCHAIADEGASREHTAPPFKVVANTSGMTAIALTVWLQTSHPTMPNIIVEPKDMSNVIAYILSLKD